MGWTKRGAGIPLRDRVRPQGDAGGESDGVDGSAPRRGDQEPCPARHCWVHDPRGDDGTKRPGLLVEWRQRGELWEGRVSYVTLLGPGQWALVEEWLPAHLLAPS